MRLSEVFDSPEKLEAAFEKIVDGRNPLRRAVEEANNSEEGPSKRELRLKELKGAGKEVIKRTNLEEMFSEYKLIGISRNGKREFREYLLDYTRFGVLFDFRRDKVTTHT